MQVEQFVGGRVAAKRRELQLDAPVLARHLGVAELELSEWEAGARRIPTPLLVELASVLGCSISYFFCEP